MYLEKCNETQLKEIYREFNITEESLMRDVKYLMEWMEKQPHLPNVKGMLLSKPSKQVYLMLITECKNIAWYCIILFKTDYITELY